MTISAIAAIGNNYELGAANDLLWHLPNDFKWFVNHTKNKAIIMGKNTMNSLKKPLKNRLNIVVSKSIGKNTTKIPEDINQFVYCNSIENAINLAKLFSQEILIIGGAEIYKQSLLLCDKLYITRVHQSFDKADVFFPKFESQFKLIFEEKHRADDTHLYHFSFEIYEKI